MPSPHPATRVLIQHRRRVQEILRVLSHHGIAEMFDVSVRTRLGDFMPDAVRARTGSLKCISTPLARATSKDASEKGSS